MEIYPECMLLELVHHGKLLKPGLNGFTQIDIWSLLYVLQPWMIWKKIQGYETMALD
jgi:hypothetical protein